MSQSKVNCHVCEEKSVQLVGGYQGIPLVASDSRGWNFPAELGKCEACGSIVKNISPEWEASVSEIYASYQMYHQSGGAEKLEYGKDGGPVLPRSEKLIEALMNFDPTYQVKNALDVGTGNGAMLRALSKMQPEARLSGQDLSDSSHASLAEIPGFQELFVCSLAEIDQKFDFLSMIHVLEHVVNPVSFLREAKARLSEGGYLVVNIPDAAENPIDLLVFDHCTHFTLTTLLNVLRRSGFKIAYARKDLLGKELVAFCQVIDCDDTEVSGDKDLSFTGLSGNIKYLRSTLDQARKLLNGTCNGIFGASLAGVWVGNNLLNWTGPFVDEDPARVGSTLIDHEIVSPLQLKGAKCVFVPLAPDLARRISSRLSTPNLPYILPDF